MRLKSKALLAAASAVLATGGIVIGIPSLADTNVTYADAQTWISRGQWVRLGANSVACNGTCRTATASNTYRLSCEVSATGATVGACLVSLAGNCSPAACENAQ
jgi:riboflavin synthase alpha subunit